MFEESTEGFFNKPPQEKITTAPTQLKKPTSLSLRNFLRSLIGSRQQPEATSNNQMSEPKPDPIPSATPDKTQPPVSSGPNLAT